MAGGCALRQPKTVCMNVAESGHAHERVGAQAGGRAWPRGPHVIFNVAVFISCSCRRAVRFCRVTWSTRCPLRNTHTIFRCFPFWAFVYNVAVSCVAFSAQRVPKSMCSAPTFCLTWVLTGITQPRLTSNIDFASRVFTPGDAGAAAVMCVRRPQPYDHREKRGAVVVNMLRMRPARLVLSQEALQDEDDDGVDVAVVNPTDFGFDREQPLSLLPLCFLWRRTTTTTLGQAVRSRPASPPIRCQCTTLASALTVPSTLSALFLRSLCSWPQ